jgi:hypothetical protein
MASDRSLLRYRCWYARLLRLYPKSHYERFGESMAQTFNDLCRDRRESGERLSGFVLWLFMDTSVQILKERVAVMMNQDITRRLLAWAIVIALLLLVPLVAMQFTDEVNWNLFDFVIMGCVLFGIGLAYELLARRSKDTTYRVAFGIGLVTAFLLFWVNGAIGIIGNEGQPANLLYGAVFIVGLLGSIMARFKPSGMARTLFVAAAVQLLVPVAALVFWPQVSWGEGGMFRVFALNAFFATLFAASALLFRQAGVTEPPKPAS